MSFGCGGLAAYANPLRQMPQTLSLLRLLSDSDVTLPSTRAPQPDGEELTPIALRRGTAALVLVFTTPERTRRYAASAPFCLVLPGRDFLARLPADFGLLINDGYADAYRIETQHIFRETQENLSNPPENLSNPQDPC